MCLILRIDVIGSVRKTGIQVFQHTYLLCIFLILDHINTWHLYFGVSKQRIQSNKNETFPRDLGTLFVIII